MARQYGYYTYHSDTGQLFAVRLKENADAIARGGWVMETPGSGHPEISARKCRLVHLMHVDGGGVVTTKTLASGTLDSNIWSSNGVVTIDTVSYYPTSRRSERIRYPVPQSA